MSHCDDDSSLDKRRHAKSSGICRTAAALPNRAEAILRSRALLRPEGDWFIPSPEAEGGCGVTGFACTIPVEWPAHLRALDPDAQPGQRQGRRHCRVRSGARGNGRLAQGARRGLHSSGGAVGFECSRPRLRKTFIEPYFNIDQAGLIPTVDDYREVPLLEVRPPDVARYFVRVKPDGARPVSLRRRS